MDETALDVCRIVGRMARVSGLIRSAGCSLAIAGWQFSIQRNDPLSRCGDVISRLHSTVKSTTTGSSAKNWRNVASTSETTGDTEVLLAAWSQWQEGAFDRFDGMFAFALDDGRDLVLATDPFGEKPLYVARVPDGIWFASEPEPLIDELEAPLAAKPRGVAAVSLLRFYSGTAHWLRQSRSASAGHNTPVFRFRPFS